MENDDEEKGEEGQQQQEEQETIESNDETKSPSVLKRRKSVKTPTPEDDVDRALAESVRGLHELAKARTSAPNPDVNLQPQKLPSV